MISYVNFPSFYLTEYQQASQASNLPQLIYDSLIFIQSNHFYTPYKMFLEGVFDQWKVEGKLLFVKKVEESFLHFLCLANNEWEKRVDVIITYHFLVSAFVFISLFKMRESENKMDIILYY